jgi:hypothetical protein
MFIRWKEEWTMSLTTVLSVEVRPDRANAYESHVHELASKAVAGKEPFEWIAHQVIAGPIGTMHFVSEAPDWAALGAREPIEQLARRLLGENEGALLLDRIAECVVSRRFEIARDRADLSYPVASDDPPRANTLVSVIQARPGGDDACEELIRKVAQAIPLVKDPRRFTAYEAFVGPTRTYWIVTPLADMADLDRMLSPRDLLQKAFGAEGVLLHRTGFDAIERLERQLIVIRPELSNATWLGDVVGRRPRAAAAAAATH